MTHRPSFPIPGHDNEFYIEQAYANGDAWIYDTRTEHPAYGLTRDAVNKFTVHAADGYHPDCVICQADPRTAMELRSNVISAALKGDDLTSNERAELWAELAEITTWFQKDDQDNDPTRANLVRNIENAHAAAARETNLERARRASANAEYFEIKLKVYDETGEYQM